jgi:hypothetical protein
VREPQKPREGGHIICRGSRVQVPFPVQTWETTGWQFHGRNRTHGRVIVQHWTGAENAPVNMYANMLNHTNVYKIAEPLSVHFAIDQMGLIYQLADTELKCVHTPGANAFSIGIEHIGRGSDLSKPAKGWERERVTDTIHGHRVRYDNLLPAQIEASVRLNEALCALYGLPMRVPEDAAGKLLSTKLTDEQASVFRGCAGHLHFGIKNDPGLRLLQAIQERGRELAR